MTFVGGQCDPDAVGYCGARVPVFTAHEKRAVVQLDVDVATLAEFLDRKNPAGYSGIGDRDVLWSGSVLPNRWGCTFKVRFHRGPKKRPPLVFFGLAGF